MKRIYLSTAMLFGMAVFPAVAADLPAFRPAVPEFSWTGFYAGGNAGFAWATANVSQTLFAPAPFVPGDAAAVSSSASPLLHPTNAAVGVQAGYNHQWGNFVLGGEVDFDYLHLQASKSTTSAFPSTLPGGVVGPPVASFSTATSASTNWLFTARPRLGWAVGTWLFYATGGLALARETFNQSVALVAPFTETTSLTANRVGWTAGAGVEYAINRNWSIKGEYLHVDLASAGTAATLTPPFPGLGMAGSFRLTTEIARAGVNYHF
jgi:outer membrane immunogenic protein